MAASSPTEDPREESTLHKISAANSQNKDEKSGETSPGKTEKVNGEEGKQPDEDKSPQRSVKGDSKDISDQKINGDQKTEEGNASSADPHQDQKTANGKGRDSSGNDQCRAGGGGYEIVGIRMKHGKLRKAVPAMPLPVAIVLCLINVVLPGIGTFLSGFTVFCGGKTEYESRGRSFSLNVIAAVLQIILIPILVGWIWSILWGVTFVTIAVTKDGTATKGSEPTPEQV